MNIQEKSFIHRFKKYMSSPYRGQIVFLLILLYVISIFFLEVTLVPNRIALLFMFIFSILSYLYYREPLRLRLSDLHAQLFFILPLFFFIVNGCNDRVLMLNIVVPMLWLILGSRFFSSTRIIIYVYKSLNISICIVFFLCLTSVLLKLSNGAPEYWWNSFVHKSFVEVLNQHPSYLSLYALAGVNANLNDLYCCIIKRRFQLLTIIFLIVSIVFLILVSAKMAYIILALFFLIFLGRLLASKKYIWALSFVLISGIIIIFLYMVLPSIGNRITTDYKTFVTNDFEIDNNSPASERIHIWRTSITLIKENPFGRFCMDTKEQIWSRLDKTNKQELVEKNAHNNFLEFGLRYGVLGIIVLFLFVLVCFYFFIKYKDFLFLGVLLIFLLFSMTESTLVREMGVIYMAFIFQLHLLNLKKPVR
ncbi:O-antigen ligase family protein [Zobellia russellii]|uniref:O-antigen ligase family protein n=1 Tax=Zobellia russellii TaxID=248907 RepID=UPI0037DDD361